MESLRRNRAVRILRPKRFSIPSTAAGGDFEILLTRDMLF
jgi:hypothetical protein